MVALDTLPPEIRSVIYSNLFQDPRIWIYTDGTTSTLLYPYQISCVSKLLRRETLPLLRTYDPNRRLRLICEGGRFPDKVRRRMPHYIFRSAGHITVLNTLKFDELKPSLSTFPNLKFLEFVLGYVEVNMQHIVYMQYRRDRKFTADEAKCIETRRAINDICREMHAEQERPREGLERDYFVEGTFFDLLKMTRSRRGFNVVVSVEKLSILRDTGMLPGVKFDWDEVDEV